VQPPDPTPQPLDHLTLRGTPSAAALLTKEGLLDYAGLERAVASLAASLKGRGIRDGARVASWLPKGRMTALLPLACARAGLVNVPINPLLKRAQVSHILADSGASLLLSGEARLATLEADDLACPAVAEAESATMVEGADGIPPSSADPDSVVALLYTSGSTGRAKGVMLTHANLWLGAVSVAYYLGLGQQDRTLAVLPFSFDYGQNQLLAAWASGGAAVPLEYISARDVIRAIEAQRITTLAGVPPLWIQLVEAAWPPRAALALRRLTNSGGRLPTSVVRRMRELFPAAEIHLMYGLTEAFRSTSLDPALVDTNPDSIGTAIPFAEVIVARPDGSEALPGEEGELVHKGPLVAKGYWNDPERSAERFRNNAVWSGDRVRRDEAGLLYFVGREDGMIKTSGNRVSPTEIEEEVMASGVAAEAAAFGYPDHRLGEAIALVLRGDRSREVELRNHLKRRLPNFMQPSAILWRDELPRSPNGKLDRERLKQELMA
jgi:acyl-CoA ligase (AMP-forming) (exosortase A-associated)